MISPDTASNLLHSLDKMSDIQYFYLFCRLGAIFIGFITTLLGFAAISWKVFIVVWAAMLKHIKVSLGESFATPSQMTALVGALQASMDSGFALVAGRLQAGDFRMDRIEGRCVDRRSGDFGIFKPCHDDPPASVHPPVPLEEPAHAC
jgi:hypothetical protein